MTESTISISTSIEISQTFLKIGVFKNFAIFTGKHLRWRLFLTKLEDFRPATILKIDSNTDVFL